MDYGKRRRNAKLLFFVGDCSGSAKMVEYAITGASKKRILGLSGGKGKAE